MSLRLYRVTVEVETVVAAYDEREAKAVAGLNLGQLGAHATYGAVEVRSPAELPDARWLSVVPLSLSLGPAPTCGEVLSLSEES